MLALTDQMAVVTGASSGIGKAIALALAAQGARLCLVGRQLETLLTVQAAAGVHQAPSIHCYPTDLASDRDIRQLATRLREEMGPVDVLIHSAGIIAQGRIDTATVRDLDDQYRLNVRAPYLLTQALLPSLRSRRGQVVFINSTVGLQARANLGPYAASKHALRAVADSLRDEVNADGIRVLSVYLGRTATPMQAAVFQAEGRPYQPDVLLQPQDVASMIVHALTLPRTAEVTEISMRPMLKSY